MGNPRCSLLAVEANRAVPGGLDNKEEGRNNCREEVPHHGLILGIQGFYCSLSVIPGQ